MKSIRRPIRRASLLLVAACLFSSILTAPLVLRAQQGTAPAPAESAADAAIKAQIAKVLDDQVNAWNLGSIDKFMDGYWRNDSLRFASGTNITYGWQATLNRYKSLYSDRASMGTLSFSDMVIDVLSPDAAIVFGRFRTKSVSGGGGDSTGLFTLTLRKLPSGWKITSDHTSLAR